MNIWNKRMRDLREDSDKTQKDVAKYLNVSQRTYSHYENGERNVPIEIIIKLSELYKLPADYILGIIHKQIDIKCCKNCKEVK